MYLSLARRLGVEIVRAPDLAEGGIDPDAVRDLIRRRRPDPGRADLGADQLRSGAGRSGRSARSAARPACPTWWTPARRWGRCRSTRRPSAATTWPAPARKFLRGPARDRLSLRLATARSSRRPSAAGGHARRHLDRPRPLRADARRTALRVVGDRLRPRARPRRRGALRARRRPRYRARPEPGTRGVRPGPPGGAARGPGAGSGRGALRHRHGGARRPAGRGDQARPSSPRDQHQLARSGRTR